MRMIVFFDLPSVKVEEKREYLKFRKFLIENGFIMMQESIYTKLALNKSVIDQLSQKLEKVKPKDGQVQILVVTEKQFASMKNLVGSSYSAIENSVERLIVL